MAIKSVTPYLMFDGTAAKAIQLYESALGAKAEGVVRFGDTPGAVHCKTQEDKDRIMNATLHLGATHFMASDGMPGISAPTDSNIHVALDFEDVADMTTKFNALAEGGKVTLPLHDSFWGAKFGMLTDAFGIRWMFNCEAKKS
jgi:PhnB protein